MSDHETTNHNQSPTNPQLTPERLAELRRLAEAVRRRHPTPWHLDGEVAEWYQGQKSPFDDAGASLVSAEGIIILGGQDGDQGGAVGILTQEAAGYYAALDSQTVLALLDRLEAVQHERDAAESRFQTAWSDANRERGRAEQAERERDTHLTARRRQTEELVAIREALQVSGLLPDLLREIRALQQIARDAARRNRRAYGRERHLALEQVDEDEFARRGAAIVKRAEGEVRS